MMGRIQHGDRWIKYELIQTSRRSLGITVRRDQKVEVRAPKRASVSTIEQSIQKKAAWILKHQQRFAAFSTIAARGYSHGEKHFFFGKEYEVSVVIGKKQKVTLESGKLHVEVKLNHPEQVQKALAKWFLQQAKDHFPKRIVEVKELFQVTSLPSFHVQVRTMKSRWGSCSSKGKITLSSRLIHYPPDCIDYVMVHELCHLLVPNHSRKFYDLMTKVMPTWPEHRKTLRWSNLSSN